MDEVVEEEFDLDDILSEDVDTGLLSKEEQMRQIEEQIKVGWGRGWCDVPQWPSGCQTNGGMACLHGLCL